MDWFLYDIALRRERVNVALEIAFNLIKDNNDIHSMNFFDHTFLYIAYADDLTFFLKKKNL